MPDFTREEIEAVVKASRKLPRANLAGIDLNEANLYEANLRGADLIGANLNYADLQGADLRGASLLARLQGAIYNDGSSGSGCNVSV